MAVHCCLHSPLDVFGAPGVGRNRQRARTEARLRALEVGSVPAGDHDPGALRHERLGDGEADALRPAGDQRDLAVE